MPIFAPGQERKPERPVLEVLLAVAFVVVGLVELAVVAIIVGVYATGGSIGIVPGAHASHR